MQERSILVTGGGGYVGVPLVASLLEQGHRVTVLDRFYFGRERLNDGGDRLRVVEGDIRDHHAVEEALQGADTLIHLASLSNDPSCELKEDWAKAVNYDAAIQVFEAAKSRGVRDVVFYSSCSVYGAGVSSHLDEGAATHPVSLYAKLKLDVEAWLQQAKTKDFRPLILRNATLFGLSPRMRFDLAINVMTLYAYRDKRIFILGGGEQWRPFLHLQDLIDITRKFLRKDFAELSGEVFNCGHPELNLQIKDLAPLVQRHAGDDVALEVAPGDADRRSYRVDFTKLANTLGHTFRYGVEEGVKEIHGALAEGRFPDLQSTSLYNIRRMQEVVALPARNGGEKARSAFLPFCLPSLGKEEEEEVVATLRSGWITTGPRTKRFEESLGEVVGNPNVLAVSSCTAALHLSLLAAGVGPGDEVVTTPLTFASTANVIVHTGATPVFADVDPDTLLLTPPSAERAITERTKAIIPVDLAGQSCAMPEFMALGEKHGIKIIQDAAHSIGAAYGGQPVGSMADYTCFSFYPIKNMTTGEGGALVFKDPEEASFLRAMSLHGLSKDAWRRYDPEAGGVEKWSHYEVLFAGFKYNMTDMQAALGLHQLKRLEGFIQTRERYAHIYQEAFADIPEIQCLRKCYFNRHSWHLLIIKLDLKRLSITRDEFLLALKAENIGAGIHFRAVHLMPFYRERFGHEPGRFPHAEAASEAIASLPLYPGMSSDDVYRSAEAVRKIINHYRKAT